LIRRFAEFTNQYPRFGEAPVQICHQWNTVAHLAEYEG